MPFKNTGKLKPALSAAGAAVHHGFHLVGVQTVLGHSSPSTTLRYVAVPDASLRAVVNAAA